jgi:epoxyqueuosine reductase QueG
MWSLTLSRMSIVEIGDCSTSFGKCVVVQREANWVNCGMSGVQACILTPTWIIKKQQFSKGNNLRWKAELHTDKYADYIHVTSYPLTSSKTTYRIEKNTKYKQIQNLQNFVDNKEHNKDPDFLLNNIRQSW